MKAVIVGISGPVLLPGEASALREHQPAGVVLFRRNIVDPAQLSALVASLRGALPAEAVLMVDQEGGRVARLRPPHWRAHPPAEAIGQLWHRSGSGDALRAAWLSGALIGLQCRAAGFDVACAPVLDLRIPGANFDVVGDRAFDAAPDIVAALGGAMAQGLLAAGVQPVGKHAPGHGRSEVDSHHALPVVTWPDLSDDMLPFIRNATLPWLMTAHILYPAWDTKYPATLSADIIGPILRGRIGFAGVLVSDDLSMHALDGAPVALMQRALAAGCDVALHCMGEPDETLDILRAAPVLAPPAIDRLAAARALAASKRQTLDEAALADERAGLLA